MTDKPHNYALLSSVSVQLPPAVVFSHITRRSTPIPEPPKTTVNKYRRHFNLDSDAANIAGVSLNELNRVLLSLPDPPDETEVTNILSGKFVMSSAGRKVPLDNLLDATIIQVTRPLIFDYRCPQQKED